MIKSLEMASAWEQEWFVGKAFVRASNQVRHGTREIRPRKVVVVD